MTAIRKTHHEMIREAIIELKEARPKVIIEYIKKKNPQVKVNESSFRADIIGCSINHSSTHHYPGMPKFLFFKKQKGTYSLYDPERNGKPIMSGTSQKNSNTIISDNVAITDAHVELGEKILQAFNNNVGLFRDFHSEAGKDNLDPYLHLNYITFTSAIDYQKNIKANDLWQAGKRWAKEYPWLFKPRELINKPLSQVIATFELIREQDSRFFRIQDIGIWLLISEALCEYDGKVSKLLEYFNFDAWKIYNEFNGPLKKKFPFLSGDKILPMWLKILSEDAGIKLNNLEKLPLPVDKNVAEATYNLILGKEFDGSVDKKTKEVVSLLWKRIADKLNVPVISFDTPLWTLGGEGCSNPQKTNCSDCPVNDYCHIYVRD